MIEANCEVIRNIRIAKGTYEMILRRKKENIEGDGIKILPGQFLNIKIQGFFLRRPISIAYEDVRNIVIVYKVVGKGTEKLSKKKGGEVNVLMPLGNGYDLSVLPDRPLLVGGGAGVPPLYGLAINLKEEGKSPQVILGFNTKDEIFYEEKFRELGLEVTVVTIDGSGGKKGTVVDWLEEGKYICACGPTAMLKAVDVLAAKGQYSFEERMACGFGACMGCSCETKSGNKRICREGPVLKKEEILWPEEKGAIL